MNMHSSYPNDTRKNFTARRKSRPYSTLLYRFVGFLFRIDRISPFLFVKDDHICAVILIQKTHIQVRHHGSILR